MSRARDFAAREAVRAVAYEAVARLERLDDLLAILTAAARLRDGSTIDGREPEPSP